MEERITQVIEKAIEDKVFPGCVVGIIKNGKETVLPFGRLAYEGESAKVTADTVYDLASITKAIPTNSAALKLIDEWRLSPEDRLIKYVPEYEGGWREEIKIKHLMTYTMVLDIQAPLSSHIDDKPEEILKFITHSPLMAKPGEKFWYTNTPSILLGLVLERIYGKKLDLIGQDEFFGPLKMVNTRFGNRDIAKENVAPTEIDPKRGIVQGFVHDEVTWALQKKWMVGCAGVFGTVGDLLKYEQMLLNKGEYDGKRYFSEKAIEMMYTNQLAAIGVSYGLGWELNQPRFMGSGCEKTFGKTGFTGVMMLINILKQTAMVLLSNTTFPRRKVGAEAINSVRSAVADIIFN